MTPRKNMANLRMHESMNRYSPHQHSTADPGADGEIHRIFEPSRRTPTMLRQRRCVGVRVEADGTSELMRQTSRNVGAAPSHLGSVPAEAVAGRGLVQFHRTEGRHADGREGPGVRAFLTQKRMHGRQRGERIRGWEAHLSDDISTLIADGTYEFRAAGFNGAEIACGTRHGGRA